MQLLLLALSITAVLATVSWATEPATPNVVLAIHGGTAGERKALSAEHEREVRADLERALQVGFARLKEQGGTSLDAVEAAVRVLEDSPHFNAGKGAIFTHEGRNELDASIMEGKTHRAGAVASVSVIKNPVSAARAVLEKSKHVLLVGRGAEVFAAKVGLECVDPSYFWTEERWRQIEKVWQKEAAQNGEKKTSAIEPAIRPDSWGTVGAVARDFSGNLAAATSTGGMSNKMAGRVGDSPIIGAGTYADNETCAVSGTGHGEFFIRNVVAYDIAALMKYKGLSVEGAAAEVVLGKLKTAGGEGGVIALDHRGNFTAPYNTPGLYRGHITRDGKTAVRLYVD